MTITGTRSRSPRRRRARRGTVAPARSAAVAGGVDHRAVGERVGERHAELDQVGAGLGVGEPDPRASVSRSGKPPIRYGISAARRPSAPGRANASAIRSVPVTAGHARSPSSCRAPRRGPCRRGRRGRRGRARCRAVRERPGERVGALERRDDPLERGPVRANAASACGVGDGDVARAAACRAATRARARCPGSRARRRSSAPRGSGRPRPA